MDVVADLPQLRLIAQVAITLWLIAVSVLDHRSGRIPNSLTAPVFIGVGLFRVFQGFTGDPMKLLMLVAWGVIFLLWMAHFIGGGDAKVLMGLYALFPSMEFTAVLALILLVIMVPLVAVEWLRRRRAGEKRTSVLQRMATGQMLPSEQDLQERGRRYAWTFAVPAILYTWIWW